MGSSLVLTGGAATAKTLKESISLTSHGFSVGDVLRWNNGSPSYVRAQADSAANAEVLGIVSANTDVNTFELTYAGYVDLPQFAGISYPVLFLSGVCAGGLTHNPPSAVGTVIKPVVTRHPTLNGYVMNNYLGTQIGGSSTIGIDEIQPVGTIMPFAGSAIPDTWLACDGNSYAISEYPELYQKLCYTTGVRAPIYGHVVDIALSSGSSAIHAAAQVGDYIFIKNHNNASGSLPAISSTPWGTTDGTDIASHENTWDLVGLVIAKGTGHDGGQYGVQVQILPKWTSTGPSGTRRFVMPNAFVQPLNSNTSANAASSTVLFYGLNAAQTAYASRGIGNINTAKVLAFTVPDLSGRFPVGVMNANSESASGESDNPITHISGQLGPIELGAMGGEDRHQLTQAEMPAHKHQLYGFTAAPTYAVGNSALLVNVGTDGIKQTNSSWIGDTGGNAPHNNMPPYLAVRYIIKAKPYTRAAIIDGVDLPYSNLLVRSTDSNSLRSELLSGASGGDLVFYTNSGEASKTGTERMRLTAGGTLGIGTTSPVAKLDVRGTVSISDTGVFPTGSSGLAYNRLLVGGTGAAIFVWDDGSSVAAGRYARIGLGSRYSQSGVTLAGGYIDGGNEGTTDHSGFLKFFTTPADGNSNVERMRITSNGSVGIGTSTPGASLDVNGTLKVGNFGDTTNVMPKLTRSAGVVGQVVPLLSYYNSSPTTPLNQGTWFVFFVGYDNSTSGTNEDANYVHAKVWVVPSGYWLVFAPRGDRDATTSNYDSGYAARLTGSNSQANPVNESPAFKDYVYLNNPNGHNTKTGNQDVTSDSVSVNTGGVGAAVGVGSTIAGYAIRIA